MYSLKGEVEEFRFVEKSEEWPKEVSSMLRREGRIFY